MAEKKKMSQLILADVKVLFKNFKGEERTFNRAGARNFCVSLDAKQAEKLEDEGWHIRWREPRNEDEERLGILQIKINYNTKSASSKPTIVMINGNKKTRLDEEAVECLDTAEIESADIIARPYEWTVRGESGVSAYLKSGYFKVIEDEFYSKYYGDETDQEDDLPF